MYIYYDEIIMKKIEKINKRLNDKLHAELINKFQKTIKNYNMLVCEDSVLAGVSGGPDSMGLILFLMEIRKKYSLNLGIAHINHCLRGKESDRDEKFVRNFASRTGLPFFSTAMDVKSMAKKNKLSIEEAARNVRYSFYKEICEKHNFSKTALAHNSDDNAELVLMNLLRGSGPKGLSGIPIKRNELIIRPLIDFSKKEILNYLQLKNQDYVIDSSNNDLYFLRNRIRHSLIPFLEKEYNPSITDSLNRLSHIIRDEDQWMGNEVSPVFEKALIKHEKNEIQLDYYVLSGLHRAVLRRIIRMSIKKVKGNLKRITLKHIDAAMDIIASDQSEKSLDFPDRIRIYRQKGKILFKKEATPLRQLVKKNKIKQPFKYLKS